MFAAIKDHYGSFAAVDQPEPITPERYQDVLKSVDTWRSSPEIVDLSEYLKANKQHGIGLVLLDGRPTLHINPGLDLSDKIRRPIVEEAMRKMMAAQDDMESLLSRGLLAVMNHPGFNRPESFLGPSPAFDHKGQDIAMNQRV